MLQKLRNTSSKVLRKSENYTGTDMIYLTKGGFWLGINHLIILLGGLAVATAFANLLPKDVYGTYQFVMSVSVIISSFTLTGMATAVIRAVAKGNDGALRAGFKTQIIWSTGIAIAGGVFAAYYFLNGNNTLSLSFLIVGTLAPFLEGFSLTRPFLLGKKMFRQVALHGIWRRLTPVAVLLITILLTHNPVLIVLAYFASHTLSAGLLYLIVIKRYSPKHTKNREMIGYSKHLSVLKTFGSITNQMDKVLIFHFLGAAPVAAYALAMLPVKQIEGLFTLLYSLTFPKMNALKFSYLKKVLPGKVRILTMVALLISIIYFFLAPFIFKILFPTYPESILISQILILIILSKPRALYKQAFVAHKFKKEQYIMNLTVNILKITLLLILLPIYGIWGAVYTLLIAHLILNVLSKYLFKKA